MINIQYFRTAQDIIDAYGSNIPSNVVCVAGNNDSVLINTSNNNPHSDKEEQDKPTIVNKINNQDITVNPTKETITLKHNNEYTGLGTVTVNAVTSSIDSNITSDNIKEGVSILGVEGTLKEEKPEEMFDVQPTTSIQTITPTEGYVFSKGIVEAVTSDIDINIQPENIKQGVSILGVTGTLSEGSGGESNVFVVPPEMKFGFSTFTELPSNFDFRMFSNVTDASYMFYNCTQLTTIPLLNTSNVTDLSWMFYGCHNLTSIPQLITSNATDLSYMFNTCRGLTTIPLLDTSKATNLSSMFDACSSLTSIPQLITSNATDLSYMFANCHSLTTIPSLDTSNATNLNSMFNACNNLTTIPSLDTSKATEMTEMLGNCENLTTVEGIDFSGLTSDLSSLFGYSSKMPNITRFIVNGKINVSISDEFSIKALTEIDYDSVKSILAAANRTDNTNSKTLAFNRTIADQNGELAALVTSCTSKGWIITGLTIN